MNDEALKRKLWTAETDLSAEYTRRRKLEYEVEQLKQELAQKVLDRDAFEGEKNDLILLSEAALAAWDNCGAEEFVSPKYGNVYTVDPASFDEIAEILRKAAHQ